MLRRLEAQQHLDELALSGDASTVLITAIGGMGGIGKTTLAVKWAHEVAHRYVGIDDKAYLHEPKYATLTSKQALDNADSFHSVYSL